MIDRIRTSYSHNVGHYWLPMSPVMNDALYLESKQSMGTAATSTGKMSLF